MLAESCVYQWHSGVESEMTHPAFPSVAPQSLVEYLMCLQSQLPLDIAKTGSPTIPENTVGNSVVDAVRSAGGNGVCTDPGRPPDLRIYDCRLSSSLVRAEVRG